MNTFLDRDDYRRIAKIYPWLTRIYSLGAVERSRAVLLNEAEKGQRVCFVGVGQGVEALQLARQGAKVTVIDRSESMLESFKRGLVKQEEYDGEQMASSIEIVHGDVSDYAVRGERAFDLVVCHYFLNVFSEDDMPKMLDVVLNLSCEKSGRIVIADFWYDREAHWIIRLLQKTNWNVALAIFRLISRNAKHRIYLYDHLMEQRGWVKRVDYRTGVLGLPLYRSVTFSRE